MPSFRTKKNLRKPWHALMALHEAIIELNGLDRPLLEEA